MVMRRHNQKGAHRPHAGRRMFAPAVFGIIGVALLPVASFFWGKEQAHADALRAQLNDSAPVSALPRYPGMELWPLGEQAHVDGVARSLGYGVTSDMPQAVGEWYASLWKTQGMETTMSALHDTVTVSTDLS